jgi:hypothetical protein
VVGLWKKAWVATSADQGRTWSVPVLAPGVAQTFAKLWGQRTEDGRYALAYDPQDQPPGHRWPLAVATSDDGITFGNLLAVHGEVPQRRYPGFAKDIGPQYVRGLENDGGAPGGDMWLTYSVNKEDIWVSRIPVPIHSAVSAAINDTFEGANLSALKDWNIYSPLWAPVQVADDNTGKNKALRLNDGDPYDYARAVRVFPRTRRGTIAFRIRAQHSDRGRLEIELADCSGRVPIRIVWNKSNHLIASGPADTQEIATFQDGQWKNCRIDLDTTRGRYSLTVDGRELLADAAFAENVESVERISFRTGKRRAIFREQTNFDVHGKDKSQAYYYNLPINPSTDHPEPAVSYYIDDVTTNTLAAQASKNTD